MKALGISFFPWLVVFGTSFFSSSSSFHDPAGRPHNGPLSGPIWIDGYNSRKTKQQEEEERKGKGILPVQVRRDVLESCVLFSLILMQLLISTSSID